MLNRKLVIPQVTSSKVVGQVPPNLLQIVNSLLPGVGLLNINQVITIIHMRN